MTGESIQEFIGLAFVALFFCYIVYTLFSFLIRRLRDAGDGIRISLNSNSADSLKNEFEKYLLGRFHYYDKLSEARRTKFLLRVRKFIRSKSFEGRQEQEITEEIKVLVAAAAVQLTFGLENYTLDYFSSIIIYPESYYSPITGLYHQGEANPKGIIVISWKDFLKGYDIADDTYNVGLHEMAHALELEEILGGDYDIYFAAYYEKWKRITREEYEKVRDDGESFFRSYAGTNIHEFFSVCIEHFFEATEQFKIKLPQIYHHLCILLNQDPLNKDYIVEKIRHKSLTELQVDVLSSTEVFITRNSYASLFSAPAFLAIVLSFQAFYIKPFNLVLLIVGVSMILIFTIPAFFIFNKIVLYDKYIGIKNTFGKLKAIFLLDEIVSISFETGSYGGSMNIVMVENGKIYKSAYSFKGKSKDTESLKKLLSEKDVIVKPYFR